MIMLASNTVGTLSDQVIEKPN